MPLFFLVVGLLLIVTVVRGTVGDFSHLLAEDVSGGFLKWLAAILVIGILGYAKPFQEPSRYLLGLVALVVLLTKGSGFVSMLGQQLSNPGQATPTQQAGGNPNLPGIPIQSSGGSSGPQSGQTGGLPGGISPSTVLQAAPFIASSFL